MSVDFSSRLVVGPEVLVRQIADESVLLNLKTETYFGFDALGTRVWTVLVSAPSIQAALDALLAEYEVSEETLRADLGELIDELIRRELVAIADAPA